MLRIKKGRMPVRNSRPRAPRHGIWLPARGPGVEPPADRRGNRGLDAFPDAGAQHPLGAGAARPWRRLLHRNCSPHIICQTINVSSIGRRLDTKLHEQMKICVNSMLCLMARPQIHLPNVKMCLDVVNTYGQRGWIGSAHWQRRTSCAATSRAPRNSLYWT